MAALDIMSFLESAVVELSDAGQQNAQLQILQVGTSFLFLMPLTRQTLSRLNRLRSHIFDPYVCTL